MKPRSRTLKALLQEVDALFPPAVGGALALDTYNYSLGKFPRRWQFVLTNNWYAWSDNGYEHQFGLYREPEYAVQAFLSYVKAKKINVRSLCHDAQSQAGGKRRNMVDRLAERISRIKAILADDLNYQADSLKIGAIWDVCDRAASYKRGKDTSGGDFIEVLPPGQSLSLESVRSEALRVPVRQIMFEALEKLERALQSTARGAEPFDLKKHMSKPEQIIEIDEDGNVHSTELRK